MDKTALIKLLAEEGLLDEKTDSINVSKTSTGKFSFDIKIYHKDLMAVGASDAVVNQIKTIQGKLSQEFPDQVRA